MSECTNTEMRDLLPLVASRGTAALAPGLEAHLAGCADCRDELALIEATRIALSHTSAVDVARIARSLPAYRAAGGFADPKIVPIATRRRSAPAWRIAAAALVLVGGATALAVRQASDITPAPATIAGVEAAAPAGAESVGRASGSVPAAEPTSSRAGSTAPATRAEGPQMTFGGGLDDLSEEELVALLAALDDENVLTPTEPEGLFPSLPLDGEEES